MSPESEGTHALRPGRNLGTLQVPRPVPYRSSNTSSVFESTRIVIVAW